MPFAAHLVSTGSIRTYQEEEEEESVHDDPFHQMIQELEKNLNHQEVNILIKVDKLIIINSLGFFSIFLSHLSKAIPMWS